MNCPLLLKSYFLKTMPGKKGSKKLVEKQSLLGKFQKNKKVISEMQAKVDAQNADIIALKKLHAENQNTIDELNKKIDNQRNILAYKRKKIKNLNALNIVEHTPNASFTISSAKSKKRLATPTSSELNQKAKITRFNETLQAANSIHGSTSSNLEPSITGLLGTLTSKVKAKVLSSKILSGKPALIKQLKASVMKEWTENTYKSKENILRSLNTYYSHNVMGKRKYINLRQANKVSVHQNAYIPNYVPFKDLSEEINSIDIGVLHDVNELIPSNTENYQGCYRDASSYILRLAKFYLTVDKHRKDKLKFFPNFPKKDGDSKLFALAIGGDGAPGYGTSILVSFLNCGDRIASSSENFLLFGSNADETSPVVAAYLSKLVTDICYLESKSFIIDGVKVEFAFGELPSDMKMLCFLSGELSNGAQYFSSFGNVTLKNCFNPTFTFGSTEDHQWKPWNYNKRLKVAGLVEEKKKRQPKISRNSLTTYIACLGSRQEFKPRMGKYIDCAKAEPLHLKNNVIKEQFMKLFKIAISKTNLKGVKTFANVPKDSLLSQFVNFVHDKMSCNFLSKKIKRWFNDNNGAAKKDFGFRFRGKESFHFMQTFPELISMIYRNDAINDLAKYRLVQIHCQSILMRELLSFCVRITSFNAADLEKMKNIGKKLFTLSCLFDNHMSPSLWTLCNVTPIHASICFEKYNMGLGCNTMEGREQKHQAITRYAENTTFQNRWPLIFRHEYIQLIHLRENGFDKLNHIKRTKPYVPVLNNGCTNCAMIISDGKCFLCDTKFQKKVEESILKVEVVK